MNALRDALTELFERDGELTPQQVVVAATPEDSELHRYFEWDDSKAAAKHRLHQARSLIRSCRITVITRPEETVAVRAFVNVPDTGYVPTETALTDPAQRDVVLQQLQRDIAALRRKYGALIDVDAAIRASLEMAAA